MKELPLQQQLFNQSDVIWSLSAKWALHHLDCTVHGITTRCNAMCCVHQNLYPPSCGAAYGLQHCYHLTPTGCSLGEDRPVICHLFPLRLNLQNKLIGWGRMCLPGNICYPNINIGPTILDTMHASFALLFGKSTTDYIIEMVSKGKDPYFAVPAATVHIYEIELQAEQSKAVPLPRSTYRIRNES